MKQVKCDECGTVVPYQDYLEFPYNVPVNWIRFSQKVGVGNNLGNALGIEVLRYDFCGVPCLQKYLTAGITEFMERL